MCNTRNCKFNFLFFQGTNICIRHYNFTAGFVMLLKTKKFLMNEFPKIMFFVTMETYWSMIMKRKENCRDPLNIL